MPKLISGSVGQGGSNNRPDSATIQYLLNCVHTDQGGPVDELVVDGLVGPKTIGAIYRFQKSRFKGADGRVDPGGKTLSELHRYDPYPDEPAPVLVEPGGKGAAKGAAKGSGAKDTGGYAKSGGKDSYGSGKTGAKDPYGYGKTGGKDAYGAAGKGGGSAKSSGSGYGTKTQGYDAAGKGSGKTQTWATGKTESYGQKLPGKFWTVAEGKTGKTG